MRTHRISDPTGAGNFPAGPGLKPVTAGRRGCQRVAMEISDVVALPRRAALGQSAR